MQVYIRAAHPIPFSCSSFLPSLSTGSLAQRLPTSSTPVFLRKSILRDFHRLAPLPIRASATEFSPANPSVDTAPGNHCASSASQNHTKATSPERFRMPSQRRLRVLFLVVLTLTVTVLWYTVWTHPPLYPHLQPLLTARVTPTG